jgi:ABC-type transport system involved in cytochrome bd biosynthesis fused ATPase/permease subunit
VPARTNPSLGRLRVKAGDSGNSFLMDKLLGILSPDDGHQMPYDNSLSPVSDDDIRKTAEWIDQGAMR